MQFAENKYFSSHLYVHCTLYSHMCLEGTQTTAKKDSVILDHSGLLREFQKRWSLNRAEGPIYYNVKAVKKSVISYTVTTVSV